MNEEATWKERYQKLIRALNDAEERHATLEALLRRYVLRLVLASRGQAGELDQMLDRVAEAMRSGHNVERLQPLLEDLNAAVAKTEPPALAAAKPAVGGSVDESLRDALDGMLQRLDLDPALGERTQELGRRVKAAAGNPEMAAICHELGDLLAAQRERARREKADVQRMLVQVDARLNEFVGYFRGEEADRKAASENRQRLDEQMLGEVRQLSANVQEATELVTLQTQVRSRLELMDNHLREFRHRETHRAQTYAETAEKMRSRVEQLEQETRSLQASLAKEQANSTTDALTGIPNRLAYGQRMALEFKRWLRFGRPLCIAAVDIDHFKQVNDSHGHSAGDQVLRMVGKTLASQLRGTDFVARYGGEEFVMLLVDTPLDIAAQVLDKLRGAVGQNAVSVPGRPPLRVTVSLGVAEFRQGEEPEAAFERADQALYRAKKGGRDRVERAD